MVSILFLIAAVAASTPKYEWKRLYYTVNGPEVVLWESPSLTHCIIGTGPTKVVRRLQSRAISGEADLLVEVLPAPKPLDLPQNVIVQDYTVKVRGIPVQPQCEQSKGLYWIRGFRFIRNTVPAQ